MEYILYSLSEYKLLAVVVGFLLAGLEPFIPMLPLIGIIIANAFVLGLWQGFLVSWIGSSLASIALYYLASKFSKMKFLKKYVENKSTTQVLLFIEKQGFTIIFVSYLCPFIPDFLVTIASGISNFDIKTYISAMMSGKFVMFLLISYIGKDVESFFYNPIKVSLLVIIILMLWIIGKKINKKIHKI